MSIAHSCIYRLFYRQISIVLHDFLSKAEYPINVTTSLTRLCGGIHESLASAILRVRTERTLLLLGTSLQEISLEHLKQISPEHHILSTNFRKTVMVGPGKSEIPCNCTQRAHRVLWSM